MLKLFSFIHNLLIKIARWLFACHNKNKTFESMKLYKNIDVIQINVKAGVSEYFLPKNVDWADEVIDKLVVYAPAQESGVLSPIDLKNYIIERDAYSTIYFDLYREDGTDLAYSLSVQNLVNVNNYPIEINSKISLQLSRIFFSQPPIEDKCILIYVFWGGKDVEDMDLPQNSVTVTVDVAPGNDVYFDEFIDTYIHAQNKKVKGIDVWGGVYGAQQVFMTLRDHNYKTITNLLPCAMCRPQVTYDYLIAEYAQVNPLYLDNADIDFANSYLRCSADSDNTQKITITLYY